jgi:hypothetical protein
MFEILLKDESTISSENVRNVATTNQVLLKLVQCSGYEIKRVGRLMRDIDSVNQCTKALIIMAEPYCSRIVDLKNDF